MNKNLNNSDLINSYLEGNISDKGKLELESLLEKDPLFKSEFEFQKDIVEGLKEYRKAELKARLDGINVNPGIFGHITNLKIASSIITASVISVGVLLYLNQETFNEDDLSYVVHLTEGQETISIDNLLQKPEPKTYNSNTEKSETISKSSNNLLGENSLVADIKSKSLVVKDKAVKEKNVEIVRPNVLSDFEDQEILSQFEKAPSFNKTELSTIKGRVHSIEIENRIEGKFQFHYKYFQNKLYLYGDFISPYEILELNNEREKKLYLFHEDVYYAIQENQEKITPLKPITQSRLIKELNIIKENKLN
jgi:hypothetical protein